MHPPGESTCDPVINCHKILPLKELLLSRVDGIEEIAGGTCDYHKIHGLRVLRHEITGSQVHPPGEGDTHTFMLEALKELYRPANKQLREDVDGFDVSSALSQRSALAGSA